MPWPVLPDYIRTLAVAKPADVAPKLKLESPGFPLTSHCPTLRACVGWCLLVHWPCLKLWRTDVIWHTRGLIRLGRNGPRRGKAQLSQVSSGQTGPHLLQVWHGFPCFDEWTFTASDATTRYINKRIHRSSFRPKFVISTFAGVQETHFWRGIPRARHGRPRFYLCSLS